MNSPELLPNPEADNLEMLKAEREALGERMQQLDAHIQELETKKEMEPLTARYREAFDAMFKDSVRENDGTYTQWRSANEEMSAKASYVFSDEEPSVRRVLESNVRYSYRGYTGHRVMYEQGDRFFVTEFENLEKLPDPSGLTWKFNKEEHLVRNEQPATPQDMQAALAVLETREDGIRLLA